MATTVLETTHIADDPQASDSAWSATPIATRLATLKRARHELARVADQLVAAISPTLARTRADSYAAEVLPLLSACKFLEQQAATILRPRHLGTKGLPFWLAGIDSTVERAPLGKILIIAPSNYPLFLAGVQALQALAAGNSVVWKPGREGRNVADVFARALAQAGLPTGQLRVTDESVQTAIREIEACPQKIVFTGSSAAGRAVLHLAAERAIPVIAELSGCDAVIALPSANPALLADALAFGMRLNGSATCMAPRRLFLIGAGYEALLAQLTARFAAMEPVELTPETHAHLAKLIAEAEADGATLRGTAGAAIIKPLLLLNGKSSMRITQTDLFAPVLTVIEVGSAEDAIAQTHACPFGLTAAIFGEETAARELGRKLNVGTVLINDLIVPTADPRVPFGGRRGSGFGATRGAEGLLEMTSAKVTQIRKAKSTRHFQPTGSDHEELFRGAIAMSHSATWSERFTGLRKLVTAARQLK